MRYFHLLLFKFHRLGLRRPRLTACVALLAVIIGLIGASQYRFLLSVDDLVDPDFRSYSSLMRYKENFPDYNSVILSIETKAMPSQSLICDVQKWGLRLTEKRPDILRISSTYGLRQARIQDGQVKFDPLLNLDCQSEDPQVEKIEKAFADIKASPWKTLLTDDNNALTLSISFEGLGADNRFGEFNADTAQEIRDDFEAALKSHQKEITVHWAGVGTYQYELRKSFYISQALNLVMFGFVLLFFRFFMSSWSLGLWFILTIDATLFMTYGAMGFLKLPVDVLTNSTGMMLLVSTLEDFIIVAFGTLFQGMSWRKSMRTYLVPAFWTSLTTAIGFASLGTSDLSIIQRFGWISAFAGMVEWAVLFVVMPALLTLFKSKGWPRPRIFEIKSSRLMSFLQKITEITFPKWATYLMLLVFPLGLWGSFRLIIEDAPEKFFAKDHIITKTSDHLFQQRGWRSDVTLLFQDDLSNDRKLEILQQARQWPNVAEVEDLPTLEKYLTAKIDSEDHQQAVIRFWRQSPFLLRLKNDESERAVLYLKNLERNHLQELVVASEKTCPNKECEVTSGLTSYVEFGERVLTTLFESLFWSLVLVIMILIMLSRLNKSGNILAVCISSLWGPVALLSVFYVFNIPVFFVTTICAAVLVGLSGDNCIQFIFQKKSKNLTDSIQNLILASLLVTIAMIFVTVIFFFSPMWPLQKLGGLMILGFWLSWVGDVLILKGLVKK